MDMRSQGRIALLLLGFPAAAGAQTFTGRILDGTDSAVVSGAEVIVTGVKRARSGGLGTFRITDLPAGRHAFSVRMLGYAVFNDSVDVVADQASVRDVYLTRVPRLLSQINVKGRSLRVPSGFEDVYRRADASNGTLITREQIDSINPRDVAGLLHQAGSSVRASPNRDSPARLSTARCQAMVPGAPAGGQPVTLFLNGTPLNNTMSINEVLDHLAPSSIQAVEVYNGPTSVPPAFQPACGVVAIWTRRG